MEVDPVYNFSFHPFQEKQTSFYDFFFHPFHEEHTPLKTVASLVTIVALSILTLGVYFVAFACIQVKDWSKTSTPLKPALHLIQGKSRFVGTKALKKQQEDHLRKLQKLAYTKGNWEALREHTLHPHSAFDWWMFPIDRGSETQGDLYTLSPSDVAVLKADNEFMKSYREGVKLILNAWGWDPETHRDISNEKQKWTDYQIRLGKMIHSLLLFDQGDLFESVSRFCQFHRIQFRDQWISKKLEEGRVKFRLN